MEKITNILIVDDDSNIRTLIIETLEDTDYGVINAYGGNEALSILEEKKPDLIILDILLDMMTGDTFLLYLKSSIEYEDIPVIIVSNLSSRTYKNLKTIDPNLVFLEKTSITGEKFVAEIKARIG